MYIYIYIYFFFFINLRTSSHPFDWKMPRRKRRHLDKRKKKKRKRKICWLDPQELEGVIRECSANLINQLHGHGFIFSVINNCVYPLHIYLKKSLHLKIIVVVVLLGRFLEGKGHLLIYFYLKENKKVFYC